MDQINGGNNDGMPPTMPVKRKRGRPRKDKSLKPSTEITASLKSPVKITPSLNHPLPVIPVEDPNGSLVGQPVRGVIEASFDGGFLLNVHIGNSGTCLRGVVFKPGHHLPVSAENGVVPHIQMVNRKETPNHAAGNAQVLKNGSLSDLETSKVKGEDISVILPVSDLSRGMVSKLPSGVSENKENLEIEKTDSRPYETNGNKAEDSSQTLEGDLENGDNTYKSLDLEPLVDVHSVNHNTQSQEALESYDNSTMGAMSMLLQAVQEKMTNPGGSN